MDFFGADGGGDGIGAVVAGEDDAEDFGGGEVSGGVVFSVDAGEFEIGHGSADFEDFGDFLGPCGGGHECGEAEGEDGFHGFCWAGYDRIAGDCASGCGGLMTW